MNDEFRCWPTNRNKFLYFFLQFQRLDLNSYLILLINSFLKHINYKLISKIFKGNLNNNNNAGKFNI